MRYRCSPAYRAPDYAEQAAGYEDRKASDDAPAHYNVDYLRGWHRADAEMRDADYDANADTNESA
jgi:hypothetical protein